MRSGSGKLSQTMRYNSEEAKQSDSDILADRVRVNGLRQRGAVLRRLNTWIRVFE